MEEIKADLKLLRIANKTILTSQDLEFELGVSRNQLYTWRKNGKLKYYGKGKKKWYLREDVIKFIKSFKNEIADTTNARGN